MFNNIHIPKHVEWWRGGSLLSPEVLAMLLNYATFGSALAGLEKDTMIDFVDNEVFDLNHQIKDYAIINSLAEPNSLVDFIGGKVATKSNAPIWSINGYLYNGTTQKIITNYNPTLHAVNYSLNDAEISSFVYLSNSAITDMALYGQNGSESPVGLKQNNASFLFSRSNTGAASAIGGNVFNNKTLYGTNRINAANQQILKNGVIIDTEADASTTMPNAFIDMGKGVNFFNGTISNITIGASIGGDSVKSYNNLVTLLTAFGVLP